MNIDNGSSILRPCDIARIAQLSGADMHSLQVRRPYTLWEARRILRIKLARERSKGRCGHNRYDLNHHIALKKAYDALMEPRLKRRLGEP